MDPVTALQVALVALKAARDTLPKVGAHKDRCVKLIDRCERLMVDVCSRIKPGSPMPLARDLKFLEDPKPPSACITVRDATMNLSGRNSMWAFLNKGEVSQAFETAEKGLTDAFAIFNVNAHAPHGHVQDQLRRALKQDQQHFLIYLDSLLKGFQRMISTTQSLTPTTPGSTSNVHGSIQSPISNSNSISWRIQPHEVLPVEDPSLPPDGTIGKVRRGRMDGKVVAVKHIHGNIARALLGNKNSTRNFEEKVKKWVSLSHPNVSQFIGVCSDPGQPFLVTEYAPYRNIMVYTQYRPDCDIFLLLHQIASGMHYLHDHEIIHANLKPSNILVRADFTVIVHDYELTLLKDYATLSRTIDRESWRYTAPEYMDGDTDYPADVYSFAMCAWEIFTGFVPFGDQELNLAVDTSGHPQQFQQHQQQYQLPGEYQQQHQPLQPNQQQRVRKLLDTQRPPKPAEINEQLWVWMQQWWNHHPAHRMGFGQIETLLRRFLEPAPDENGTRESDPPAKRAPSIDVRVTDGRSGDPGPQSQSYDSHRAVRIPASPVPTSSSLYTDKDHEAAKPLSKEGKEALSKVMKALNHLMPFDKLASEILSAYPDWFKTISLICSQLSLSPTETLLVHRKQIICSKQKDRVPGISPLTNLIRKLFPELCLQEGSAKAIAALGKAITQWVDKIPWLKGADISDRRRAVIFITVICIMAEDAFRLKMKAPYRQVDAFIDDKLARSDFKAFIERHARKIQSGQSERTTNGIYGELTWIVERGCQLLYSSEEDSPIVH